MRKTFFVIAAVLLCSIPRPGFAAEEEIGITLSAGKRVDNLDWSIAGGGVNVLSELTWKDIESYQIKGKARIYIGRVYLRGHAAFAFIVEGENQDSDYAGNDRTLEWSRSNNKADSGNLWDVSGGAGYVFRFAPAGGRLDLIPVVGLSYHKQNLRITDGFQTIPALGPFPGLDSTYSASWAGPWAGVDAVYSRGRLTITGSVEYHIAGFNAVADWNLRTDFAHPNSFEQWADGRGVVASLGAEYALDERWTLAGSFDIQDFRTSAGTDRTYFSTGGAADTRLNGVNWDSKAFLIGLNYRF